MRLGILGLGVIASVSLLVTAVPERIDSAEDHREKEIDHSAGSGIETDGISRAYYPWPVRVISLTSRIDNSRSGFVKNEHGRRENPLRLESSSFPSLLPSRRNALVHLDNRNIETATKVSRFPIDSLGSTRASTLPQNSERSAKPSNDWSNDDSVGNSKRKSEYKVTSDSSVTVVSTLGKFEEKFVATLDSPISNFITGASMPRPSIHRGLARLRRRQRRSERKTIERDEQMKSWDRYEDKRQTRNKNEMTKTSRSRRSSIAESAITMSHRLTTMTSTTNETVTSKGSFVDVNFRNATEHYESQTTRNPQGFFGNKEKGNVSESRFLDKGFDPIEGSTERIISYTSKDLLNLIYRHSTNYPSNPKSNIHSSILNDASLVSDINDHQDDDDVKSFDRDRRMEKLTNSLTEENLSTGTTLNVSSQRTSINDSTTLGEKGSTPKTLTAVAIGKHESQLNINGTENISQASRIAHDSLPDVPIIGTRPSRLGGNIANTSGVDIRIASLDNHKAIRVRSFQPTDAEHEKQGTIGSVSSSLPSRLPGHSSVKGNVLRFQEAFLVPGRTERPLLPVNQIPYAKSLYPSVKNNTKQSINLLDGKSNKIFYEIKPSLITDMDHDDTYTTTTTRRSIDKFLLPSVPSGKFGPYFLDEEDRRNVTERIGNTVLLNCRIGLLGHRKVTWLQHYKDSFRLLTIEQESYSADRRISLNFQYPDNWRLQIAYAAMRDSGLYKCQVEIDHSRSLVKRYNVIITAPILTITDDSGRPISGERHLKAGSALKLRCEARDIVQKLNESVLWMRGDETLVNDVSENKTTEIVNEKEITVVVSTLFVERAIPRHAGNYSCVVPNKARTTIAVHVLNGELPAAVQHGSGVSTAVLNIWLVHLTASYGFFR